MVESEGVLRLTLEKKREILLNSVFGVDLDPQAVEVAQLSLYLKLLEDETTASAHQHYLDFAEALLPSLGKNVVRGNSLIGTDILFGRFEFSAREERKLAPMDFRSAFSGVMNDGGFDAVVGNPPYVRIQTTSPRELAYYSEHYESAVGNFDIYCLFMEQALGLLNPSGVMAYIVPHRFFKADYGEGLRNLLGKRGAISEIVDFDGYMVFEQASINTAIVTVGSTKESKIRLHTARRHDASEAEMSNALSDNPHDVRIYSAGLVNHAELKRAPWVFVSDAERPLWGKLNGKYQTLGECTRQIFQGLKTGADGLFIGTSCSDEGEQVVVKFPDSEGEVAIEKAILRPLIKGGEMKRFRIGTTTRVIVFPYADGKLIDSKVLMRDYPAAWKYLTTHKHFLSNREGGKHAEERWYGYTRTQALSSMPQAKIVTPDYYAHASYGIDVAGTFFFCGGGAGGYGIVPKAELQLPYLAGILNSRLLDWYLQKVSMRAYQTAYMYLKKYISQLPILTLDLNNPAEKKQHDRMVQLVEAMLATQQQLAAATSETDCTYYEGKAAGLDRQIDELTFNLYGLTDEEIALLDRSA